jgi:hypothetical protein
MVAPAMRSRVDTARKVEPAPEAANNEGAPVQRGKLEMYNPTSVPSLARALQSTRGNYYVQSAIEGYNNKQAAPGAGAGGAGRGGVDASGAAAGGASGSDASGAGMSRVAPAAARDKGGTARTGSKAGADVAPGKVIGAPGALGPVPPATHAAAQPPAAGAPPRGVKHAAAPGGPGAAVLRGAGGPTLAQWKSRANAAAGVALTTTPPKAAAGGAQQIADVAAKRADQKADFKAEAKQKIPPPPKTAVPAAPADTLADSIHKSIAEVSDKRLTDQTLPVLEPSPGHADIRQPTGQFPVVGPAPAVKEEQPPAQNSVAGAGVPSKDPAEEVAQQKKKQVEDDVNKQVYEAMFGPMPPPSAVVHDTGPKPPPEGPPIPKADIGEALAVVLSQSEAESKEMVDIAERTAYPHGALKQTAPQIATDALAPEKARLETELHTVAAAAGVEARELDAKAARKAEEARTQSTVAETELECKATDAQDVAQKKAAQDRQAIADAAARNDNEIELKAEAAGKPPDPKLVNEREQRLLDTLDSQSSNARVAYRKALEARNQALADGARDQVEAYRRTGQAEADEIRGLYPGKEEQAKAESWPSISWANREAKRVNELLAVLERDAGKESQQFQDAVTQRQTAAAMRIHEWADTRLSKTRSFWEELLKLFEHWEHAAKSDTEAWERARDQDTVANMTGDLATIAQVRQSAARGNIEEFKAAVASLDEAHQILVLKYFQSGGDSILAVAGATLGRIEARRVPELADEFRSRSMEIGDWQTLNDLARSIHPGFNAWHEAGEVRGAVKGWGTDEDRLFASIKHRSPLEIKAMTLAYADRYDGRDMQKDIDDDLSGDEADRAAAALKGDVAGQDVAALHDALTGFWGTDKTTIMETLRGKSPIERDDLLHRYKDEYNIDLRDHLDFALDSDAKDQANALLGGDTDLADSIGVQRALHSHFFGGADIGEVDAVYAQIRKEVEGEAEGTRMTTAEVEAEYKRRTAAVSAKWGATHGEGKPDALTDTFKDRFSGGEADLTVALVKDDHTAEDAARIRMESESILYTSDKQVLSILRKQRDRATVEVKRDTRVRLLEQADREHWSPEKLAEQLDALEQKPSKEVEDAIDQRAQANLDNLEKHYDKAYSRGWGPGELTAVVEFEMSGNEQEEARLLRKHAGKMTGAEEVHWAIKGLGTDEDLLRHALQGKTRAEIAAMAKDYHDHYDSDMFEDIMGDVSGRDEHDFRVLLEGEPQTPEEKLRRMHEDTDYELGPEAGMGHVWAGEETDSMKHAAGKADLAYQNYLLAARKFGKDSPEAAAALKRFNEWTGYTAETVTELRQEVDSLTDHLAMAAAIVVGVIVAAATWGTATPAVIAAVSAMAGTAASMTVKLSMKGHAYGIEDYGTDLALGAVDAAAAALTAGVGNALLRTNLLARLSEEQLISRTLKYGTAHVVSGMIAGVPSGMLGQLMNPAVWQSRRPLHDFLTGLGQSELMAGALAFGFGAHEGLRAGGKTAPAPHEPAPRKASTSGISGGPDTVGSGGRRMPPPTEGKIYVEPGSPEYHAMLHEGWTAEMLRGGLGPFEPRPVPHGAELHSGVYRDSLRTPQDAYTAYNEAIARAPGREVGIFRNQDTGEYVVSVGDEGHVTFPEGTHEAVLHYHPNPDNILTFRMPSHEDLVNAWWSSARSGRPATQFVEHAVPGSNTRARTAFTVDSDTGRIRVEYAGPEGRRASLEFAGDREYLDYYQSRKIAPGERTLADMRAEVDAWLADRRGGLSDDFADGPQKSSMAGGGKEAAETRKRIQHLETEIEDLSSRQRDGEPLSDEEVRRLRAVERHIDDLQAELERTTGETAAQRAVREKSLLARRKRIKHLKSFKINAETRAIVSELEDILGHEPDPFDRMMAALFGTWQDQGLKKRLIPALRKLMPKSSVFSSDDWAQFEALLEIDKVPWDRGMGPDMFLVDPKARKIKPLDLTGRKNTGHEQSKQKQAENLQKLLAKQNRSGDKSWTVEKAEDFSHEGKKMTRARLIEKLREYLEAYGYTGP